MFGLDMQVVLSSTYFNLRGPFDRLLKVVRHCSDAS